MAEGKKFTADEAKRIGERIGIDWQQVAVAQFRTWLAVDLLGDGGGTDTDDGEGEVARHSCREGVGNLVTEGVGEARHLS